EVDAEEEVEEVEFEEVEEEKPVPKIIDGSARRPKRVATSDEDATLVRASFQGVSFEGYQLPPLDLLNFDEDLDVVPADESHLIRTQNIIVETLGTFGLEVYPGDITRGPSISRYEIYPSKGLRVGRIAALEPDIARATKADRINIIAPIPGKDTVGIEIANKIRVPVPLRELLDDPVFRDTEYKIPLALGKDVYGNVVLADLASMPHLLVAGATGSGKSVCINSIVASLLFQFSPEQLRFIMVDPKVVEMQIYNDLPHMVVPVVTDPKKVILALRWVVKEMERRYKLFADFGVRNFDAFNERDRDKEPKKPTRAPSRREAKASPAVAPVDSPEVEEDTIAKDPADSSRIEETSVSDTPSEESSGVLETATVSTVADDDDDDSPPFFVHEVNLSEGSDLPDEEADPLEADEVADEGCEEEDELEASDEPEALEDDTSEEEKDLPPHEFASRIKPDKPEIPDTLPYIVVIIDELADLMQTAPADVELAIGRITQMARAAGIHLIVATQTPRAEVVTGKIKANIPCRIAFQVSSGIDSRVILDEKGADRLVGKGDMLYLPPGTAQLVRCQGALISDDEIRDLVECCRKQGEPVYEQEVEDTLEGKNHSDSQVSDEDEEILAKCLDVIHQEKRASTSLMQRRLGLGYTRAARMMDILEERGYVGPGEGAKPREILMDNIEEDTHY
ncbi:MAG: DNA translocase FtsK, partial [Verrucomicrobiales bacterium]